MKRKWSDNPSPHRKLHVPPHFDHPQKGDDVKALQRAINQRLNARKIPGLLEVDGQCGRHTVAKGRLAARSIGVGLNGDGLTIYAQRLIREPAKRSDDQKARGKKWVAHHDTVTVKVDGNAVTGGTDRERIVAAAIAAVSAYESGHRPSFYSQPGAWTVDYAVTGEPHGYRSDCSQWLTSTYKSAGVTDPNGTNYTGGYTGTLVSFGQEIRRDQLEPGDYVIYGPGSGHHVEEWVGNGDGKTTYAELARVGSEVRDRTAGHGSPPVDFGDIDMIAGARFFRCKALA